jgi:hypothetical protein
MLSLAISLSLFYVASFFLVAGYFFAYYLHMPHDIFIWTLPEKEQVAHFRDSQLRGLKKGLIAPFFLMEIGSLYYKYGKPPTGWLFPFKLSAKDYIVS